MRPDIKQSLLLRLEQLVSLHVQLGHELEKLRDTLIAEHEGKKAPSTPKYRRSVYPEQKAAR